MGTTEDSDNLAIAFAMVIGAGASTGLGASVVFFPSLVKLASKKTLAGGLGLSAGVMMYVSFVEIFQKAVLAFQDSGLDYEKSNIYSTLCFFGGVVFMVILNVIVHRLLGHKHHHHSPNNEGRSTTQDIVSSDEQAGAANEEHMEHGNDPEATPATATSNQRNVNCVPTCPCSSENPAQQLDEYQKMAEEIMIRQNVQEEEKEEIGATQDEEENNPTNPTTTSSAQLRHNDKDKKAKSSQEDAAAQLSLMSLKTAAAIALHNFPEGLATFVAALHDPAVGAVLAIAIAIHNIPEGLCVAMPVFYATGNRRRAFLWAVLSGVSEPLAALLGWAVLANSFSDEMYGVLFGLVSGMMVIISTRELLPTAHRYDPDDSVVTNMFIVGMCVMALSLVLFLI